MQRFLSVFKFMKLLGTYKNGMKVFINTFRKTATTMKFIVLALCILPFARSAPAQEKRVLEGIFGGNLFDLTTLKCDVQIMLDVIGSEPTEHVCEEECHKLLKEGHVLNYGCPLICKGFQTLAHTWHLVPETTDPSVNPCQKLSPVQ